MKSSNKAELTIQPDQSVVVSGVQGKTIYTITLTVPPGPLAGLRLEALPGPDPAAKGPGRGPNGNFVLTEIETILIPPGATPASVKQPLKFADALATYSQEGYPVKSAIDGDAKTQANNGWAVAPRGGEIHQAVFVFKDAPATGGVLTVRLHQQYVDGQHSLGRFRIGLTGHPGTLDFGLPDPVAAVLAVSSTRRTPEQTAILTDYIQSVDPVRLKLTADLAAARIPLPEDPQITARKAALALAERPVPRDPKLERLRHDADLSAAQLKTQRLTATQDLTWALINTAAFLFNH